MSVFLCKNLDLWLFLNNCVDPAVLVNAPFWKHDLKLRMAAHTLPRLRRPSLLLLTQGGQGLFGLQALLTDHPRGKSRQKPEKGQRQEHGGTLQTGLLNCFSHTAQDHLPRG